MNLLLLLRNLSNPKALAIIRSYYPCAFLIPGVVLGQVIVQAVPAPLFLGIIILAIFLIITLLLRLKSYFTNVFTLTMLVGILSALPASLADLNEHGLTDSQSYIAEVYLRPRYSRTNQVTLGLLILAKLDNSSQQFSRLNTPIKVRCTTAHLPWKHSSKLAENSLIIFKARFSPLTYDFNPFSFSSSMRRRGFDATCRIRHLSVPLQRTPPLSHSIRNRLMQLVWQTGGDTQASGVLLAMTLGVRDLLTYETETAYKRIGLAHLLVVSGYHITIVYYSLYLLPLLIMVRLPVLFNRLAMTFITTIFSLVLTLGFVWLVGIEGSSLRAALALIFLAIAKSIERGGGLFNSICTSLLVLLLIWPGCIFDVGIQLTFAALIGINIGLSCKCSNSIGKFLLVCFYASLLTSLVTLCHFKLLSLIGFILNPLLAPILALLGCKWGLMAILMASTKLPISDIPLTIILNLLEKMNSIACWISSQPAVAVELEGIPQLILIAILTGLITQVIVNKLICLLLSHNVLSHG